MINFVSVSNREYYYKNGNWYDQKTNLEVDLETKRKINRVISSNIDFSCMEKEEIYDTSVFLKKSENYTVSARGFYAYLNICDANHDLDGIARSLSQYTSCLRKLNKPETAIATGIYFINKYEHTLRQPDFLVSLSASYLDIDDLDKAKYYADKAYGLLVKKKNEAGYFSPNPELSALYARLNKKK